MAASVRFIKILGFVLCVPFFAPRYNIAPTHMAPVIFWKTTNTP